MTTAPSFERQDFTVTEVLRYFQRVLPHVHSGLKVFHPRSGSAIMVNEIGYLDYNFDDTTSPTAALTYYGRPQIGWTASLFDVLVSMPDWMLYQATGDYPMMMINNRTEEIDRYALATYVINQRLGSLYREAVDRATHVKMLNGEALAVDIVATETNRVDQLIMSWVNQFVEEIDHKLNDFPGIIFGRTINIAPDETKTNPNISCQYYFAEKRK